MLVRLDVRQEGQPWQSGLPPDQGILPGVPIVVVLSPLTVHEAWFGCLDAEERARLEKVRHPEVRAAKLAAHVLLRLTLARIDGARPEEHALIRGQRGKPRPERLPGWSCSLSHDPQGVAVAVTAGAKPIDWLGVDLCRPLAGYQDLDFVLSDAERLLLASDPARAGQNLARCWAIKEALLKRWGWGLIPNLHRIGTDSGASLCEPGPPPPGVEPATPASVSWRLIDHGPAVALAHHPDQTPTWWRATAAELDAAAESP